VTASPRWRLAAVVWAAIIFVSGMLPTQGVVHAVSGGRDSTATTVAHFVVYALLGFLLGVALSGWEVRASSLVLGLVLAAALGGVIELVQGPLPYRDAQLADFLVDVVGAVVGLVVFSAVAPARRSRSHPG